MISSARVWKAYIAAILGLFVSAVLALKLGVVSDADWELVTQLRVPRMVLAIAVGMGLSVSGATLQALFANPLCEPYTLGISSGSALGAVLGSSLGLGYFSSGIAGSAFAGAMLFGGVLFLISLRPGTGNFKLLLAGVMLSFLGSSLVALWMAVADANGIQGAILWLLGDLSRARMSGAIFSLVGSILISLVIWTRWRELDALLMGIEDARALGVEVDSARRWLIVLVSVLIGICVSGSGMIGFVGLVIPHFARRLVGSLHLRLIPLCAILGAAALTLADCLARIVARPYDLPVAVITALIGAPLFLWVMLRSRRVADE